MAVESQAPPTAKARPRPRREREEEVLVWPDLVFIEFIAAVLFTITFLILSTLINAPLLNRANADVTPNPSKAPWYFLNLQELLLHMDKAWAGVILPTIALGFFAMIPYLDRSHEGQGVYFGTKHAARLTIIAAIYAVFICGLLVIFDAGDRTHTEYLTRWIPSCEVPPVDAQGHAAVIHQTTPCLTDAAGVSHAGLTGTSELYTRFQFAIPFPHVLGVNDGYLDWPKDVTNIPVPFNNICFQWHGQHLWCDMHINLPATMTQQVIPLSTIAFFAVLIIYVLFRIGWLRTRRDIFIVMFTAVMASYLTLSIVGSFFRGQGQALIWPWQIHVDPG
jgi:menaquinol-cytochrome c reductase cytochrome b/c subunit